MRPAAFREPLLVDAVPGLSPLQPALQEPDPFAVPAPRRLIPGVALPAQRLARGQIHRFHITAAAGAYLRFEVNQHGADVAVALRDPEGDLVVAVDGADGSRGTEVLEALVEFGGDQLLEVRNRWGEGAIGGYRVEATLEPEAGPIHRRRAAAAQQHHRGEALLAGDRGGAAERRDRARRAALSFTEALKGWHQVGDGQSAGFTELGRGRALLGHGDTAGAARAFRRAGNALTTAERRRGAAVALHWEGEALLRLDQPQRARALFAQAAQRRRELGDGAGAAESLTAMALLDHRKGRMEAAEEAYREALVWVQGLSRQDLEASVLHHWGLLLRDVGRSREAQVLLLRALELRRHQRDEAAVARTLVALGHTALDQGHGADAFFYMRGALAIHDRAGDRADAGDHAAALDALGLAYGHLGLPDEALRVHEAALEALGETTGHRAVRAAALHHLGWQLNLQGFAGAAATLHEEALELFRRLRDREGEAAALLGLARCRRQLGASAAAYQLLRQSIEILEQDPPRLADLSLGAFYFAQRQEPYHEMVDLLMDDHLRANDTTALAAALEMAERARSRGLLETLSAAAANAVPPDSGNRPPGLWPPRRLLHRLDGLLMHPPGREVDGVGTQGLEAVTSLMGELRAAGRSGGTEGVDSTDGAESSSKESPAFLSVAEMAHRVLDDDTALLFYHLAPRRSFLWVLDRGDLRVYELAGEEVLGRLARQLHRDLSRGDRAEEARRAQHGLQRLGELLLPAPLRRSRLLVVADGPLHYVPFAALLRRDPSTGSDRYLVEDHEVVHIPSVSAIPRLRAPLRPGPGRALVVADPVVSADDPRLSRRPRPVLPLPRLQYSRREAQQVLSAAGHGEVLLGFEARHGELLRRSLRQYRYVHFAVHGELDDELPDLSRLIFSRFDRHGRPLALSSLYAHEIYELQLDADLVVLSACRTGLGPEIHGEGLVGLTRGFFSAGASAVMVSLWSLDDRAAARVMESFYPALVTRGLGAPGALRQAQLELLRDPQGRFAAPYYWAAFQVQGRWDRRTGPPTVSAPAPMGAAP